MLAQSLEMLPIECVVRGYITGSGWAEYQESGTVCGIPLPAGLQNGDRLPEPLFTPAYKAPMGEHDENIHVRAHRRTGRRRSARPSCATPRSRSTPVPPRSPRRRA